jgi:hypothetical protein
LQLYEKTKRKGKSTYRHKANKEATKEGRRENKTRREKCKQKEVKATEDNN